VYCEAAAELVKSENVIGFLYFLESGGFFGITDL